MINVMIVDDQKIIREGLSMMLSLCSDINIVSEAVNGKEAVEKLKEIDVDVVLMDIRMPIMSGVEATKNIKGAYPKVKVLILTTFNEDEYIFEGLKNGADGYILKDVKCDEIIKGIKTVYEGNALLHPEVAVKVVKAFNNMTNSRKSINEDENKGNRFEKLTPRELDIAKLVSKGKSNKEIGEILFITEGTVKNNLTRIMDKLQVRDRTQLALSMKNVNL